MKDINKVLKRKRMKLTTAGFVFMVGCVMAAGVSFAWFTLSTHPQVENVSTTVVANATLELAYRKDDNVPGAPQEGDTNNALKYGNKVSPDMNNSFNTTLVELRPAVLDSSGTGLAAATYGTDGRVNVSTPLSDQGQTGTVNLVANDAARGTTTSYALRLDFWVKTNISGSYLSLVSRTGTNRGQSGQTGTGSKISTVTGSVAPSILKVGFAVDGGAITVAKISDEGIITCDKIALLTANKDHKLSIYIYMDGTQATNEKAVLSPQNVSFDFQFTNGIDETELN